LNFRPTDVDATAVLTAASVVAAKSRSQAGSRPKACTTGIAESVRSITSYMRPSVSCCS
jgi:hypothetical protein